MDNYATGSQGAALPSDPPRKRVDNRTVAGVEGFVLESRTRRGLFYQYGAIYKKAFVSVTFEFPRDNAQADAWVESVLASVEWQ